MLFPRWQGTVSLPPLPERRLRIGDNVVLQRPFQGLDCKAQAVDSELPGHDLLRLDLPDPYRELLVRRKRAHRRTASLPIATADAPSEPSTWPAHVRLEWDEPGPLHEHGNTPDKVLASWVNQFDFRTEDDAAGLPGLRTPQIGALHAISAHFAVGDAFEAATVVLPTGTGKTETMLATLVYRRLKKTLVLVPSDALRTQIAGKFVTLGILAKAATVPRELVGPRIAIITSGVRSASEAKDLAAQANVIVALPNVLSTSSVDAVRVLVESCTDLLVDEAHHVTASTWNAVRERFTAKRILQFTATPFRRDEQRIDGKIIFNYKLGDAQAANYYRPINLVTVEEYGDASARDRAIAAKAVAALRADRDSRQLDHLLMARTRSKERADEVLGIYRAIAPDLKPVKIVSGPGRRRANQDALKQLLDRGPHGSRIVVCVDMLGEGFDLPNLKIAALHDNHKSLAITLQFIGRFTRSGDKGKIGDATAVTNIADPDAEARLADLYAEGADWDKLIRRLSEERIGRELRDRLAEAAARVKSTATAPAVPEVNEEDIEQAPQAQWIPTCPVPERLWTVYRGGAEATMVSSARDAAQKDLKALSPPPGLTQPLFKAFVSGILRQMPLMIEIDTLASAGLTDAQAYDFLTARLNNDDDFSAEQAWRVLKAWLIYFFPTTYRLETGQEVLIRGKDLSK